MVRPAASGLGVLYVSASYTPHDRRFLAAMARRLRRTTWLCLDPGPAPETRALPPGISRLDAGAATAADPEALAGVLHDAAREPAVDLLHAGPVPTAGYAAVRAASKPAVVMAWGSDVLTLPHASEDERRRGRAALETADGFVADAECVVQAALAMGLPATTPRAVFPWGLEDAAFAPRPSRSPLRERLGWADCHVVVSLRAWRRAYRIDVLLDAFDRAVGSDPRLRLLLLGSGEESDLVVGRVRQAGGRIVCPGPIPADEVRPFLDAADLHVSTVPSDGSSLSLLESMAAGLPSVVVGAHGNLEWVSPGRTGWLVPPGDPGALADAILAAFARPSLLPALGSAARDVAQRRARWESGVERLFRLYEAVA